METFFEMIKESLPVTSQFLLAGIVIGFIVLWCMKLYARFEKTEHATVELTIWAKEADVKFASIDKRVEKLEVRMEKVEEKIDKLEEKIDKLDEKFDRKFDALMAVLLHPKEKA